MRTRKTMTAAVLAAAASVAAMLASNHGIRAQSTPAGQPSNPPKGAPVAEANANAAVPVKQVVLFSSGVGYFEHFGAIQGDGGTELRFKSQQINDILKSLWDPLESTCRHASLSIL